MTRPGGWQDPDETRGAPGAAPGPGAPSAHAWANLAHGRLEPGLTIGGCVVESVLGRGGMGVVLRARAGGPNGPPVAVKVMLEVDRGASSYERFAREVEAVRTLDHPGIVRVLSAEPRAHVPWLVMELVEGVTLERAFADPKRSLADRLELMEQVCHAVQHAHQRGILHRDLKPANVLVDAQGRAKVTDFGLARNVGRATRLTETGTLLGTPAYLSPESIRGEDTGVAADVWALGVMLYEATAGCRPFPGGSPLELVRRIMDETPLAPSSVNPQATKAHDRVVLRALAKDPTQRHATVNDLAREVHALRSEKRAPRARARRERAGPSPLVLGLGVGAGALALAGIVAVVVVAGRQEPATAPIVVESPSPPPPATEATVEVVPEPPPPVDPLAVHLAEARAALAELEANRAERAAGEALALSPGSLEARFLLARARDLLLDPRAEADLEEVARSAAPDAYEALLLLAARAWGEGRTQAAYDRFTRAIEAAPRRHEAYVRRAMLVFYRGQKDQVATCRADIERAVELAPDSAEALRAQGALFWDDALRDERLDPAEKERLYDEAARRYDRALAHEPGDAETISLRSLLHRNRGGGDPQKQSDDQQQALARFEAQRDLARHFVEQARTARASGQLGLALQLAHRARGENSRHPLALQEIGVATIVQGLAAIARPGGPAPNEEEALLAQLNDTPKFALNTVCAHLHELRTWRARLLLAPWKHRNVAAARADVDRVLAARPGDLEALALRARARLEQGEVEGALEDALGALERSPLAGALWVDEARAARDDARRRLGR